MLNRRSLVLSAIVCASAMACALSGAADAKEPACAADNAGLTLPEGFCATVFADNLFEARHLLVAPDGTVYVNSWISPYKSSAPRPPDGFMAALKDTDGDGVADVVKRFGEDPTNKDLSGGTGIALYNGHLYVDETGTIVRYPLEAGEMVPKGSPETILTGLPMTGNHTMHSFAISKDGVLFVNSGSSTNACQVKDRNRHSPGIDPCKELSTRAGIWKYDANKTGQTFSPAERYATGLRNSVAIALNPAGELYAVPHGRDNLFDNWPESFNEEQGSQLPAELMVKVIKGKDYGWPYCYYDGFKNEYILGPEYGGDGKKTARCKNLPEPVAVFPAHWAPDGLLFYTGTAFPAHYQGGAFIAFHGSWNRKVQEGYNVVFQPLDAAGKATGEFEVFADGFGGAKPSPFASPHRPTGLAMGPDGALYVSDDQGGYVYRIIHR